MDDRLEATLITQYKSAVSAYVTETISPATHLLSIVCSPIGAITSFTLDGATKPIPFFQLLIEGQHTVAVPATTQVSGQTYTFDSWSDGNLNAARTVNLLSDISLQVNYRAPPPPTDNLAIQASPVDVTFLLDGILRATPFSTNLPVGTTHTITVSAQPVVSGIVYQFVGWSDGNINLTRTVTLTSSLTTLRALYVPTHVLTIDTSFSPSQVTFMLNSTSQSTPFSARLAEGTYTVAMPASVISGGLTYNFQAWSDGLVTNPRSINLTSDTSLNAVYMAAPTFASWNPHILYNPLTGLKLSDITGDGTLLGGYGVRVPCKRKLPLIIRDLNMDGIADDVSMTDPGQPPEFVSGKKVFVQLNGLQIHYFSNISSANPGEETGDAGTRFACCNCPTGAGNCTSTSIPGEGSGYRFPQLAQPPFTTLGSFNDYTFSVQDPANPGGAFTKLSIHCEIDRDYRVVGVMTNDSSWFSPWSSVLGKTPWAAGMRIGSLVDLQGFIFYDDEHTGNAWWELHPLTAWRPAQ